jgi:hypothetical protein
MGWRDVIDLATLDARPSTLPAKAPRCYDDELLPAVELLREAPPSAYGGHSDVLRHRRREEAARATADAQRPQRWCLACGVRYALPSGDCGRRVCRDGVDL